jgi:cytochrome P450
MEFGGTAIPKGSLCNVRYGAANRDETQFPHGDRFDLDRDNANQHLAFGAGAHFCPGAVLARQELTVGLNAILDRMDDLELARPLPDPVHRPSMGFLPMKELHIRFRKRT